MEAAPSPSAQTDWQTLHSVLCVFAFFISQTPWMGTSPLSILQARK
jgi:hypothetical protein